MAEFCCYDRGAKGGCNGHDEPLASDIVATSAYLEREPVSLDEARTKQAAKRTALSAQEAYRDAVNAYDAAPELGTAAELMQAHAAFVDSAFPMLTLAERRRAKALRFVKLVKDMSKSGIHFVELDA